MKGMNQWKLITAQLKEKSHSYLVGTRVLDKVLTNLKKRRKFAAFVRMRRFAHLAKANEFKNSVDLKQSFGLIRQCFSRYDQNRVLRGWKK